VKNAKAKKAERWRGFRGAVEKAEKKRKTEKTTENTENRQRSELTTAIDFMTCKRPRVKPWPLALHLEMEQQPALSNLHKTSGRRDGRVTRKAGLTYIFRNSKRLVFQLKDQLEFWKPEKFQLRDNLKIKALTN